MLTYTGRRNLYGTLTNDSSSANLTIGDTLMNEEEDLIVSSHPWPFLMDSVPFSSVASQQGYDIPVNAERILGLKATVNGNTLVPKLSPSIDHWNRLNSGTVISSDFPSWYFIFDDELLMYPTPASAVANAFTVYFRKKHIDLSIADYTTGTITTLANGASTVTGNGTTWTAGMAGLSFCVTKAAAALKGDGRWYEIESIDTATTMTLKKAYKGVALAAASAAYTIGQIGLLPEAYQKIPVYRAVAQYFTTIQPEFGQADRYTKMADTLERKMRGVYSNMSEDPTIEPEEDVDLKNPNDYPTLS